MRSTTSTLASIAAVFQAVTSQLLVVPDPLSNFALQSKSLVLADVPTLNLHVKWAAQNGTNGIMEKNDTSLGVPSEFNDTTHGFQIDFPTRNPVVAWEEYQVVEPWSYWSKNPQSVVEANVTQWFNQFLDDYKTNDSFGCRSRGLGQIACFASTYAGQHNYNCRIDQVHRCRGPEALQIMEHINKRLSQWTTENKVALTQRVYFAFLDLEEIQANFATTQRLLGSIQSKIPSIVPKLVKTFTPQVDEAALAKCKFTKFIIEQSIEIAVMAASFGIAKWKPPLTPGFDLEKLKRFTVEYENFMGKGLPVSWRNVGHFTYAHDNYWWNTYKAAKATKSAHNGKVAQANDIVQWVHRINSAAEMAKPHLDGIGAAPANSIRSQQNRLGLSQTTAKGMCGNLFGVTEDDNMMKMEELSAFIIQYIDDARYEIADAFDSIMKFDSSEPENAVLRLFMTEDRLASSADLSESTFRDLENQLQWDVEKYFIKELLASSRCYVECNVLYDDAKHFCPASGKAILEEEREHRFCPDKTHVCKAACLTKKQRYNKKLSVFGAKHLDKYDTSLKELLKNSWNHYNLHGSKSYEANLLFVNGTQTPTDDLFYLPVCYTKSDTIGRISLAKKYENRFPFACGRNYKSDDASEFLKDISVNLSKERYIRQKHLGWELTALHPANAYALMCNLDIHWPRRKNGYEPLWALTPGKERHCDQIRAETKHMDEFAANAHFCNKSKAASDAMDEEQTQKLTMPVQKVDNQRTKCKKFKKKYSILINLRAEAIEQKYSLYLQDQSASDMLLATIDLLTSEKEGLEAKLNDLSTTNPDLETISQLSKANAGFQKDLSALENNVSAGSPAGQNLQKLLGADLTETETEFEKLSAVNRDATEIWEAARRFSEIDEKLEVLKKERTELGMGGAKKPS